MSNKEIAALLRALADLVERSDSKDIKDLLEGKARIISEDFLTMKTPKKDKKQPLPIKVNFESVRGRLENAASYEEGLKILEEEGVITRRNYLDELASLYDVSHPKTIKMNQLADRIVSAVVDSRLQVETMRSLNISGGSKSRDK